MSKEAMKLALEALENSADLVSNEAREAEKMYANVPTRLARVQGLVALEVAHEKAITALREELAEQPAQQEPVAFVKGRGWRDGKLEVIPAKMNQTFEIDQPLYTAPPAQQEPVTWGVDWGKAGDIPCVSIIKRLPGGGIEVVAVEYAPYLYTAPPAQRTWVGLTQEELKSGAGLEKAKSTAELDLSKVFWAGARWAEAKLKEKNT